MSPGSPHQICKHWKLKLEQNSDKMTVNVLWSDMFIRNSFTQFLRQISHSYRFSIFHSINSKSRLNLIIFSTFFRVVSTSSGSLLANGDRDSGATCGVKSYNRDLINKLDDMAHASTSTNIQTSIHGGHISEVHDVPIDVLIRPFPSELDENKVKSLMETIQVRGLSFSSE